MKAILKPYAILLLVAIVFLALSVFSSSDSLDIHVHDTLIALKWSSIYFLMGMAILSMWLISIGTKNLHSSHALQWVQMILTLLAIAIFFLPSRLFYRDNSPKFTYEDFEGISRMMTIAAGAFILAQLILLTNIVIGFVRKWKRRAP